MSGLYHLVFGVNPLAGPLLRALEIDYKTVPRFRDCFLSVDGDTIIIYTRTGGNNREDYVAEIDAMRKYPGYLRDEDDSYDNTYALFYYAIPEAIAAHCKEIPQEFCVDPAKRWGELIDSIGKK
jgi:hypothetical protein